MAPSDSDSRINAYIMASEESIQLIEGGLAMLQRSDGVDIHHFTILRLLSDGIERYLKLLLQAYGFNRGQCFLSKDDMKEYGHKIVSLHESVISEISSFQPPILEDQLCAIDNDKLLGALLKLLSDFGRWDRYHYLDAVCEPISKPILFVESRWEDVMLAAGHGKSRAPVNVIVSSLERYLLCLTRSIHWNREMDGDIKSFTSYFFSAFGRFKDDDLGTTIYPNFTRWDSSIKSDAENLKPDSV